MSVRDLVLPGKCCDVVYYVDVFIKEWGILFEKKSEVGKILEGMGFEPATLGIRSAVTDYSATNVTVPKGLLLGLDGVRLMVGNFVGLHVGWLLEWMCC